MKKIPMIIDKCEDCPFCRRMNIRRLECVHIFPGDDLEAHLMLEGETIPDWCPLDDALEFRFTELGKKIDEVMKKGMGTRDIITQYMRKERLKND